MVNVKLGNKVYSGVYAVKMDTPEGGTTLFTEDNGENGVSQTVTLRAAGYRILAGTANMTRQPDITISATGVLTESTE